MKILDVIDKNARKYENRWISNKYTDDARRFLTLSAEVGELADAIKGKHEHNPDVELVQIAGICLNWLRYYIRQYEEVDLEEVLRVANHD